ncbi:MAG: N-acetylglucosamine kinase [Bacteroidetes bacterium]|nr:N-acetylglucosamine kinase [Bacteroidota bacterium]
MPTVKLIADSGSTKAEWCLMRGKRRTTVFTQGISPYFFDGPQIESLLRAELLPTLGLGKRQSLVEEVHYYGTGCINRANSAMVAKALGCLFPEATVRVDNDLLGAARALCGHQRGLACILGTGSNSCYFDGRRIVKNSPGLGYVLGDEGSGAYLGRKVLQYYLYETFDEDLRARFDAAYATTAAEILDQVYKKPLANRYLASYAAFLAANRGHYMVENILEDGLNDFFFQHVIRYKKSRSLPVHFVGGIAFGFRDVIQELCRNYGLTVGQVIRNPMEGLVAFHGM